jgi:predicted phosphodiesterase
MRGRSVSQEDLDRLLESVEGSPAPHADRRSRTPLWRAGVNWEGDAGIVTTSYIEGAHQPEWDQVLKEWDLDPEKYAVVEPVLFNSWDAVTKDGITRMRQWKAKVVLRTASAGTDWDRCLDEIARYKPPRLDRTYGDGVFHVVLADWQSGKPDGDGTLGTVGRVLDAIGKVEHRVRELRRLKRPLGTLFVEWTGDSVEGCVGHYEMQSFGVELDRRGQVKVARRLLRDALIRWSRIFPEVVVLAVGGNHGEHRSASGKANTTIGDNDDLAIVEQVAEILAANPEAFGHVKFAIPRDHLVVTANAAGWIVGLTHGHVARESGNAEQKLRRWYERMAGGKQPIGDADILVTGHYHHLRTADWGGCMWLQAPAMDGGSEWWRLMKGEVSQSGVLTFASYPEQRVADLEVLR